VAAKKTERGVDDREAEEKESERRNLSARS